MDSPLRICVLGATFPRAAQLLQEIVEANLERVKNYSKREAQFVERDGTIYEARSCHALYSDGLQGVRYDLIFADPCLMKLPMYKCVRVLEMLDDACNGSEIPEEFRFVWIYQVRGENYDVLRRDPQQ